MKPGIYKAKAIESGLCASEKKGTEFVAVLFEVTEGPDAGERIRADLYWTPNTDARVTKALKLMGWEGGVDSSMQLTGLTKAVPISVVEETNQNGRVSLKVDWVGENPFGGIDDKLRLEPAQARSFVQALRARAGVPAKNGRPAPPPAREPGEDLEDERPF
jgi:hypothetical protein